MERWPHTLPVASLALNASVITDATITDANSMAEDLLAPAHGTCRARIWRVLCQRRHDLLHQARVQGGLASAAKLP